MQNLYTVTVPLFIKMLGNLKNLLAKAEAHAKETGTSEAAFLNDALAPDMFPLKRQIQVASDQSKGAAARLTGTEAPSMEDTEETFAQLQTRLDKTIDFLKTFKEEDFKDAAAQKITLKYFPDKYLSGTDYALQYALPNFLFHVTTAYGIIRKNGVTIGKGDYMGDLPLVDLK
jgi:hypothetical protein